MPKCMESLYIKKITFALNIFDKENGAFIVSLLIKFLVYASDIRITLDQMPGAWGDLGYNSSASNSKVPLNINFSFVILSFFVFLVQLKVQKMINSKTEEDYINEQCTGVDEEKIKKREKTIKVDYYLT